MQKFLFFIIIGLFLGSCGEEKKQEVVEIIRPVKYGKVALAGGKDVHTFSGVAQSGKVAKLSFRVSGTVRTLNVQLGDRVKKGQLIATVDPADFSIQADQAIASQKGSEASLKSSETQLIMARTTYQRVEKLYENNSVPLSDFEQAKSSYETAKSSFEAAKTQVTSATKQSQAARNQVSYTRLTAPFSGVITEVNVEANELIGSGTPVAVLSTIEKPEVNVGIPENFISQIKKGQKVAARFSVLPNKEFEGTIIEISYAAVSTPTYPAVIRLINPSKEIRPGMAATVSFKVGNEEGEEEKSFLVSPVPSIGEDAIGNFAFVLEAGQNGHYIVKKRPVKIGELLPNGFEIKEGLKDGDMVATAGLRSLLDGMKVKLMEE